MTTEAEKEGVKAIATSMSVKDLRWQIANAKKLGIPAVLTETFKEELAKRGER
jgi:hypothetical protein